MSNDTIRSQALPGFRYVIDVDGQRQAAFTECTLPAVEWSTEEVKEGGLNSYIHTLPGQRKAGKVTLKNGVGKNALLEWLIQSMTEAPQRKSVTISVLNSQQSPILICHIDGAYPVKWTGPQLKSDSNSVAIQSVELACGEVTLIQEDPL